MKKFISILICFCAFVIYSQDDDFFVQIKPKHQYQIAFGLPVPIGNKAYKNYMQGFLGTQIHYKYSLKSGLSFGLGGTYNYLMTDRFNLSPQITGGSHLVNGHTLIGYEKYINERVGYKVTLLLGQTSLTYQTDSLSSSFNRNAFEWGFKSAFSLSASSNSAYQWYISFHNIRSPFLPTDVGDFGNNSYTQEELLKPLWYLSFGFSFTHYFKKW